MIEVLISANYIISYACIEVRGMKNNYIDCNLNRLWN